MKEVVILSGVRTPIGAFLGSLASFSAAQLGAVAIRGAVEAALLDPTAIDEVIMGCVLTGGMGQAPARQASLGAGLSNRIPCLTINKVCGSGMKAVMLASQAIRAGDSDVVIAGGMESMSNAPYLLDKARTGYRMGNAKLIDSMVQDGLWDPYDDCHMGNCGDATSHALGVTREEIDAFAAESYRRALDAQASGRLAEEIVPISVPQKKGDSLVVDMDEEPRRGNPAKLPTLRPAFGRDGVTTAGNASSIDDGAAALVVASLDFADEHGHRPIGTLIGSTTYAHEPSQFPTAPAHAISALLARHSLSVDDIALFEVNEAFSVVAMHAAREVGIPHKKLNVNGGAVALGHPIGMSGARLVLTALHELRRRGGGYAIASPCIGGGEATAILVKV